MPATMPLAPFQGRSITSLLGCATRILHGAKPTDLPVEAPVKYQTIVNLKSAKALGLRGAAVAARARRRDDRIATFFAAVQQDVIGKSGRGHAETDEDDVVDGARSLGSELR